MATMVRDIVEIAQSEDPLDFGNNPDAAAAYEDRLTMLRLRAAAKAARNDGGLTQKFVAKRMRTTQSAVSDLEAGRVDAQLTTWQRYARAIGRRFQFSLEGDQGDQARVQLPVAELTLSPILTELSRRHAQPVARISKDARLPLALVERVLSRLTADGWALASGEGDSAEFELVDERANIIGMSLHGDRIVASLMDMQGRLQAEMITRTVRSSTPEVIIKHATAITEKLFTTSHAADKRVLGVGVCLAGVVDAQSGTVQDAPDLYSPEDGWSDVELEQRLQARIRHRVHQALRVVVLNDANALAIAHYRGRHIEAGEASNRITDSAAVILISGAGIGAGFVVNGELVQGRHSAAGEIGHVVVDHRREAPQCRVGLKHSGCLETMATPQGILKQLGIPANTSAERNRGLMLANKRIAGGDTVVRAAFSAAGEAFGSMLPLVSVFDAKDVAIYCHAFLHNPEHATGEAFREGVETALDRADARDLLPSGYPMLHWLDLNEGTLPEAAGITMLTSYFLQDPSAWYPGLEDVVERDTELVLA